jgi:hypothetical protein
MMIRTLGSSYSGGLNNFVISGRRDLLLLLSKSRNVSSVSGGPHAGQNVGGAEEGKGRIKEDFYSPNRETHFGYETVSEQEKAQKGLYFVYLYA